MESGEGKEKGRGMRGGGEGERRWAGRTGVGRGGGRRGEEGKRRKDKEGREEKRKTAMGTEKERKTSTGLPVSAHTQSLSLLLPAGLDFRVCLQNTPPPH